MEPSDAKRLRELEEENRKLKRIVARPGTDTSEDWLQALLYRHPELLPVEEFDPGKAALTEL